MEIIPFVTLYKKINNFTARETEVAELVLNGCSNQEIGEKLCIDFRTVKFHLTSIYKKAKVKSRSYFMAQMLTNLHFSYRIKVIQNKLKLCNSIQGTGSSDPLSEKTLPRGYIND